MSVFNGLQKYLERHVLVVRNGSVIQECLLSSQLSVETHVFGTLKKIGTRVE